MPPTVQRFGLGLAPDSRTALKRALEQARRGQARRNRHAHPAGGGGQGELRPLPRPADDPDPRPARPRHRLRRAHPRRRRAQIPQLARHAALRQGPHALQHRPRRPCEPRRQAPDRGRRLYGRDRARPRRHRRGRRAQRHRASPRRSSSGMWRLDPSPIMCFDGDSAGQEGRDPRGDSAPCPTSAPTGRCASSSFPPGQDPDDVINAPAAARRSRRCSPTPSRSTPGCGATKSRPSRSTTPEAWAGPQAAPRRPRRDDRPRRPQPHLSRGLARPLLRAAPSRSAAARRFRQQRRGIVQERALHAARRRPSAAKRAPSPRSGIDAPTARALILGFANFPEELPAHCEQLAALPIADNSTAQAPRRAGQRGLLRRCA